MEDEKKDWTRRVGSTHIGELLDEAKAPASLRANEVGPKIIHDQKLCDALGAEMQVGLIKFAQSQGMTGLDIMAQQARGAYTDKLQAAMKGVDAEKEYGNLCKNLDQLLGRAR